MKIEVIELYILEHTKKFVKGSAHIYLPDFDMDLKGILFSCKGPKRYFFVHPPHKWGTDPETKKEVPYPLVSFANKQTNRDFRLSMKKAIEEFFYKKAREAKHVSR